MWITVPYLLFLIVWIGGIVFFSFIGAPSIFKSLPSEYAGLAVGAIFSKYYTMGYVCGGSTLVLLIFSGFRMGTWAPLKIFLVLVMLTLTVYAGINLHPRARALKEEIHLATSSESQDPSELPTLKAEFDRVHHLAVIYNGGVLFLGVLLIVLTARNLEL